MPFPLFGRTTFHIFGPFHDIGKPLNRMPLPLFGRTTFHIFGPFHLPFMDVRGSSFPSGPIGTSTVTLLYFFDDLLGVCGFPHHLSCASDFGPVGFPQ